MFVNIQIYAYLPEKGVIFRDCAPVFFVTCHNPIPPLSPAEKQYAQIFA